MFIFQLRIHFPLRPSELNAPRHLETDQLSVNSRTAVMNSLVQKFASSSSLGVPRDSYGAEEDESYGCVNGFGNLANGVPSFNVPAVADVCLHRIGLGHIED